MLFVDESGFPLLPFLVRTYAPRVQTLELRAPLSYDHLSVISAVTPDRRLSTNLWTTEYDDLADDTDSKVW